MKLYLKQINVYERLDQLIRLKATGNPKDLACKLGVSRATIYRYIDHLKDIGAPILYSRKETTFYYEDEFELKFQGK